MRKLSFFSTHSQVNWRIENIISLARKKIFENVIFLLVMIIIKALYLFTIYINLKNNMLHILTLP